MGAKDYGIVNLEKLLLINAYAEKVGFDEGPVFPASYDHLTKSGMVVKRGILRDEAAAVLFKYGETETIY